jgi:hypothetical protein
MDNSAIIPGQAVIEYELIVPGKKPVALGPSSVVHMESTVEDTVYGRSLYRHRLRTLSTDFVDLHVKQAMASSNPRMRFRLGVGVPDSTFFLPWQEHVIVHYSAVLESLNEQAGHTVEFETMDFMYLLTRGNLTLARKGTIGKIVTDMAEEFGLKQLVIEPTTGIGAYVQSFQDSAHFIRKRMVARARNDKGRGNYLFYFKDGSLHFHSPDYQAQIHNVLYYQANAAGLVQVDNSQRLLDDGNASTLMTVYDPYTAKTVVAGNDATKALKCADSIYSLDSIPGVALNLFHHVGPGIPEEAQIIGQNVYEHARSNTFNLILEVDKTIQIRHGDFINLVVTPSDEKASPWSGFYLVTSAKHVILKNAVRSVYVLARGEIQKSLANLTDVRQSDILVSEQAAPGQALNISEIKSSQRTKGAGSIAADGRLYTTVQAPN